MSTRSFNLEERLGVLLKQHRKTISVAESCTGGLISHRITNIAGSSEYFDSGVISYSNQSKIDILHVSTLTLQKFGAVSQETAEEMARGIRKISRTDIGIATTGIAGPSGGSVEKPVGLVYVSLSTKNTLLCKKYNFKGTRGEIKTQTADAALDLAIGYLLNENRENPKI
jgi:nicotinamide-nucleotide amidase